MTRQPDVTIRGFDVFRGVLDSATQQQWLADLRGIVAAAPLFTPQTPYGKPMSVRMTSAGRYGWFADRSGYRYVTQHPGGSPWPMIPARSLALWRALVGTARDPDCCLINFYGEGARMGLHQDRDEADFAWPVLSISLGDDGLFRMGGSSRAAKTESLWLGSGDVVRMGGAARLSYHGLDRIRFGSSHLLPEGGRINLTLRVVD